jgi:UDP-N-acetyl-D-glucosamine dehydrogenase
MTKLEILLKKIDSKEYTIGIVGLGYVGLPLMWTFHQQGIPAIGYDIDTRNEMSGIKSKKANHIFKA